LKDLNGSKLNGPNQGWLATDRNFRGRLGGGGEAARPPEWLKWMLTNSLYGAAIR
jgi:hypothetical protein